MDLLSPDWNFTKVTAIVGKFDSKENILAQLRDAIHGKFPEIQDIELTGMLLDKLTDAGSEEFKETFQQNEPNEKRNFSYIELDETFITANKDRIGVLLSEARPLKIVCVLSLESLSDLSEELGNAITGNTANYIIGQVSEQDKNLFEDVLGSQPFNNDYKFILSWLDDNFKRTDKIIE